MIEKLTKQVNELKDQNKALERRSLNKSSEFAELNSKLSEENQNNRKLHTQINELE